MIRTLASVAPLLVGVAILLTGQGLQGTLLPVRANLEGFSTLTVLAVGQQMYLFAIASAIVSIAAIPVVLSVSPTPAQAERAVRLDVRRLFRISPAGALGCLASGMANGSFWALAPVFVAGYSPDVSLAAWFMTSAVLGGALGQWPLGYWSDRVDRRWVIGFAALIGALAGGSITLFFTNLNPLALMALGASWGAVAFPLYAVSVAHTNDHAEPGEYVMISSGLLLMYGIGAILGPFVAPAMMTLVGPRGLYLHTTGIHLLLLAYVALRFRKRVTQPDEEHRPFTDSLAATQTASQVYEDELAHQEQDSR